MVMPRAKANEGFDRASIFMAVYSMLPAHLQTAFADKPLTGRGKPYTQFVKYFARKENTERAKSPAEELRAWLKSLQERGKITSFEVVRKPKGSIRSIIPALSPHVKGMFLLLGECAEFDSDKHSFREHCFGDCSCDKCLEFVSSGGRGNQQLICQTNRYIFRSKEFDDRLLASGAYFNHAVGVKCTSAEEETAVTVRVYDPIYDPYEIDGEGFVPFLDSLYLIDRMYHIAIT